MNEEICPICISTLKDPLTTPCGHHFCTTCLTKSITLSPYCPSCNELAKPTKKHAQQTKVAEIDLEIEMLEEQRRNLLESREREVLKLQLEFMVESKTQKMLKIKSLKKEVGILDEDIKETRSTFENTEQNSSNTEKRQKLNCPTSAEPSSKFSKMLQNFTDLEKNYFTFASRYKQVIGETIQSAFKYKSIKSIFQVSFAGTFANSANVNAMELNTFGLLGVVGSLKTINIYNQADIDNIQLPTLYPITKLTTKALNWSLSWNNTATNLLAVGDFNSDVNVWDITKSVLTHSFHEHCEGKFTSVNFCPSKPQQIISAGFDSQIRLWSLNRRDSCIQLSSPDKVLSLSFRPDSAHHFAVCSIDSCIHTFDIRQPDKPLLTLTGHSKSVFKLAFMGRKYLISASIDGSLKQWEFESGECVRTYRGHTNESKFIGLAVIDGHIACGSEDNSVVIYHEALSKPVLKYVFPNNPSLLNVSNDDKDVRQVTAVAWSPNIMAAANDSGRIQILKLIEEDVSCWAPFNEDR